MADEVEQEYVALLDLLTKVVDANKKASTGPAGMYYDAEGLATKLFFHAASVLYLYRGTSIPDLPSYPVGFHDSASIAVLARSALETFLTFHYVFFAPNTPDEKDFRYWCYKAAGFVERQDLPTTAPEHKQKLDEEKAVIDKLQSQLCSNSVFESLHRKQQKRILNGEWRLQAWSDIARNAGMGELIAKHLYRHKSGYAHSSALSILQIKQAHLNKEESSLMRSSMGLVMVVLASLIREYCRLFPAASNVLDTNREAAKRVEFWYEFGRQADVMGGASLPNP